MVVETFGGHTSDSADLKPRADLGRQTALRATEHDVEEFLRRRHGLDILPRRLHGGQRAGGMVVGRMKGDGERGQPPEKK